MHSSRLPLFALLVVAASFGVTAENIDPDTDDSKYAYSENVGWLNLEPLGDGGPGVEVSDFELTGWIWAENGGWISLSCRNTLSCESAEYGVQNDGNGTLSGCAWGENVGWINFGPAGAGVFIDPANGDFSGRAWGENIGWVSFASVGPHPYNVMTAWACDPPPAPPSGSPRIDFQEDTALALSNLGGSAGFDVVYGDLNTLQSAVNPIADSILGCYAENRTIDVVSISDSPAAGEGFWYLARGGNCGGSGTYDSGGTSQAAPRDGAIRASGNDCM